MRVLVFGVVSMVTFMVTTDGPEEEKLGLWPIGNILMTLFGGTNLLLDPTLVAWMVETNMMCARPTLCSACVCISK